MVRSRGRCGQREDGTVSADSTRAAPAREPPDCLPDCLSRPPVPTARPDCPSRLPVRMAGGRGPTTDSDYRLAAVEYADWMELPKYGPYITFFCAL